MNQLSITRGYFTLAGRESLVGLRQRRELVGQRRWPAVQRYGRWIAALPYVRLVAVTGALAVNNEDGPDLDFLVVTAHGRVWLCRGLVMLIGRWARRFGDEICPNYFLAESSLRLAEQNLYTAHEMSQMVPLFGMDTYQWMRRLNPWVELFLPNAVGVPERTETVALQAAAPSFARRATERLLWTAPGNWVENWEMHRKVRMLRSQETDESETGFCRDWCKGHFGGYGKKTREAYRARLQALGVAEELWELK
ncbi:MAG: hypothetical protein A2W35_12645 [Chloroflexi bacterium RBG_16_57_11]|nr:MAG: hypothetical protein A2W35_12645 [Chloroflexi bacterium RBG_16_57_11]